MQRTLYIHFGQQKTGTTSLQRFCTRHRKILATECDLIYPTPGTNPAKGPLHRHSLLFPFEAKIWKPIKREIDESGCTKALISNENLTIGGIDQGSFEAIRAFFPDCSIVFILYFRRIDDACKAWYMQGVKRDNMQGITFETFLANCNLERSHRLYPADLIEQCEQQVGRENLLLRLYDREILLNGNIVDDVFSTLDISLPEAIDTSSQYNPGIPQQALPLITDTLRQYSIKDPTRKEIYSKIINAFDEKQETLLPEHIAEEVEKEIERMEAHIPGYRQIYETRRLNFSLDKGNISPQELLTIDLLYAILFELRKKQTTCFHLSEFISHQVLPRLRFCPAFFSSLLQSLRRSFRK